MTLLAGIRLVRLNEDVPGYRGQMHCDWTGRSQMNRPTQSGEGRLLLGLGDWIAERQMARLTHHAQRASTSRWSRVCRWQVGMVAGWSLWFWILSVVGYVHILTWWTSEAPRVVIALVPFVVTFAPVIAAMGSLLRRNATLGYELLMAEDRRSYVGQLGAAFALSYVQLCAGISVALILWWLLVSPQALPLAMLADMLVVAGAFQIGGFGAVAWTARHRSRWLSVLAVAFFCMAMQIMQIRWSMLSPGQAPHEALWIAGIIAPLGLLLTWDAYRRWLRADFD